MAQTATVPVETEDFAALLDATLGTDSGFDGSVITGRIVRIEGEAASEVLNKAVAIDFDPAAFPADS